MMESEKDPALVETFSRVKEGKTSEADLKVMLKQRTEYVKRTERLEKLDKTIDNYFDSTKGYSKDLNELCEGTGSDNVRDVLKQGLKELAFRDEKQFKTIEARFTKLEKAERVIDDPNNPMNKVISDFAQEHGVDEAKLFGALGKGADADRTEQIRGLMREQMGLFERVYDSYRKARGKNSSLDEAKGMSSVRGTLDAARANLDAELKRSGALIFGLMTKGKDNEFRDALMRTMRGESPSFNKGIEAQLPFAEARKDQLNPSRVSNSWELFLKHRNIHDFQHVPPDQQDRLRENFWNKYVDDHIGERQGFWATVIRFLLSNLHKTDPMIKQILS